MIQGRWDDGLPKGFWKGVKVRTKGTSSCSLLFLLHPNPHCLLHLVCASQSVSLIVGFTVAAHGHVPAREDLGHPSAVGVGHGSRPRVSDGPRDVECESRAASVKRAQGGCEARGRCSWHLLLSQLRRFLIWGPRDDLRRSAWTLILVAAAGSWLDESLSHSGCLSARRPLLSSVLLVQMTRSSKYECLGDLEKGGKTGFRAWRQRSQCTSDLDLA